MALADEVISRYSDTYLRQLTNHEAAGSVDTTRLGLAVTDVEAAFLAAGLTYDGSDSRHVLYGVDGVVIALRKRKGEGEARADWTAWEEGLGSRLSLTTRNNRVAPQSNSTLVPSRDQAGSRPYFDGPNRALVPGRVSTDRAETDRGLGNTGV